MKCIKKNVINVKNLLRLIKEKGIRNNSCTIIFVFVQNILKVGSSIAYIIFSKELLDAIFTACQFKYILLNFCGIIFTFIIDNIINIFLQNKISLEEKVIKKEMEISLSKHTGKLPYDYVESLQGQEDLEKAIISIDLTGGIFENMNIITEIGINLVSIIFWLIYIDNLSWKFILSILLLCLLRNAVKKHEIKNDKILYKENALVNRQYNYIFGEMFSKNAGKVIRIFNAEEFVGKEGEYILNNVFSILDKICNMTIIDNIIIKVLYLITLNLTIIYAFMWTFENGMSVGDFTLFVSAIGKITEYIVKVIDNINQFIENANASIDYKRYLEVKEEDKRGIIIDKIETVEFRNVTFIYPKNNKKVLDDISFFIKQGHKVAIIGKNGSGKTTIIKLLLGFYRPTSGKIYINGIDMEKIDISFYRNKIELVDQYFRVFEGSIIENVTCNCQRGNYRFDECIKKANINDKISSLPSKEETYIGRYLKDDGVNLSGGEMQKICIARAIYKNGDILLLDEPTSAMDVYSKRNFEYTFLSNLNENIVIYITHDLESCSECDSIIVLENGKIVEQGKSIDLLRRKMLLYDSGRILKYNI